jgi:ankyrin repeat protein
MIFIVLNRFRWVFCQLEALRHCLAPRVRHMLEELPDTLDETYERMLREINKANWDHAHRLLQCLTVAVRPLRVAELAEVLAIDFGTAALEETSMLNTDWRWEDHEEAVLSACSSLISIVNDDDDRSRDHDRHHDSRVVQFSHFSVKEYLTSSRIAGPSAGISRFHILLEPAHIILARACLGVLLRLDELVDEDNVGNKFPLAQYAAEHWVDHARFENVSSHIREEMKLLFDTDKAYFACWLQVYDIDIKLPEDSLLGLFALEPEEKSGTATPLYYAALCGFHDLSEQLIIKHPEHVNTTYGYYVSPLGAALSGGHLKIAQLLYERGADVDVQGRYNRTPLHGASCSGHLEIVKWLFNHSANPNVQVGVGWTLLHSAARFGHVDVSRLLLEYKVDINARKDDGWTPLHLASYFGHVNVARLLLERGADVNARDHQRRTSLHRASWFRCLEVARLLVEHGADIDVVDEKGKTAIQVASEQGHHDIAKFLSDKGCKR